MVNCSMISTCFSNRLSVFDSVTNLDSSQLNHTAEECEQEVELTCRPYGVINQICFLEKLNVNFQSNNPV